MSELTHPYQHLPEDQYWSSGMAMLAPGLLNPARSHTPKIKPTDKIVTLGSCFAQHIGRHLEQSGFNHLVTEAAPDWMSPEYARQQHYGVYSARYGNVYTPRQAVQLIMRAYGAFIPQDQCWKAHATDHWLDPFRPNIPQGGFASGSALIKDREQHFQAVRKALETADYVIYTLGLTEAWQNLEDGAIFPTAPGVFGGRYDPERYGFINFSVAEVIDDLRLLRHKIHNINPTARIILTVSPVALAATYEPKHVWNATTYSKSVLRVAAETLAQQFDNVSYFPAYEIIMSPLNASAYFQDDMRQVNALGVAHVMRAFSQTYMEEECIQTQVANVNSLEHDMGVICDETALDMNQHTSFNESNYLEANPDVAEFVKKGIFRSGEWHYQVYGRFEGRSMRK